MKNKITFFRFEKSSIAFDKNKFGQTQFNRLDTSAKIEKQKKIIQDLQHLTLLDERGQLRVNEVLLYNYIQFKSDYLLDDSLGDDDFFQISEKSNKIIENAYSLYFNSSSKLLKILSPELKEFLIHEITDEDTQRSLSFAIHTIIEEVKQLETEVNNGEHDAHDRIETTDIINLNREIEKMNIQGWHIKQVQNIDSGRYAEGRDRAYGYSFTEGVLIVWEKKD